MAADHEACVLPELVCQTGDVLFLGVLRHEPLLSGLHLVVIVGELLDAEQLEDDPGPARGGHLGRPAPGESESDILSDFVTNGKNGPFLGNDGKHLRPRPPRPDRPRCQLVIANGL